MTKKQLMNKLAYYESVNDQLAAEITYIDTLMRELGFTDGLATLKVTAKEMVDEDIIEEEEVI